MMSRATASRSAKWGSERSASRALRRAFSRFPFTAFPLAVALSLVCNVSRAQYNESPRVLVILRSPAELTQDRRFLSPSLQATARTWSLSSVERLAVPAAAVMKKGGRDIDRIVVAVFPGPIEARNAAAAFAADPLVEYAAQERLLSVDGNPNDSGWARQWGARRIHTAEAWERTRGSSSVIVGVIDTGIDWEHPDLRNPLWVNRAEDRNGNGRYDPWPAWETRNGVPGDFDGVDDDGNGFVDDVVGYDFTDQRGYGNAGGGDYRDPDPDVTDEMGHGTAVAGIIAAEADNGIGIAGVAPACRLMVLRAFDARGIGAESDVARALIYAVDNGAGVINMSFGDVVYSRVLRDVIRYAAGMGVVMVASAGNSQSSALHYPSAYEETISVGATAENDVLAGFSNFGSTIDIVAPGVDILTTERGGGYAAFHGTSASAPFVTAVAALVRTLHPSFTPDEVRGILVASARDLGPPGWDDRYGAGLVDAQRAVMLAYPNVVRIIEPRTDFGTARDTVVIIGTAATPTMQECTLEYGFGRIPTRWFEIIPPSPVHVISDTLARWDVASLPDTTYTLRLSARSASGSSIEDRVVIRIDRSPPRFLGLAFVPVIEGNVAGAATGFIADEPVLGKVWYRRKGSAEPFASVSMEDGTVNNLFVGTTHHAFFGDGVFLPGRTYECYFTAENETGLVSEAMDGGNFFEIDVDPRVPESGFHQTSDALPAGRVYPRCPDLNGNGRPEILLNVDAENGRLSIFEHDGAQFRRIGGDAQGMQIPRGTGTLKGPGKTHLLTSFVRNGFIYESSTPGMPPSTLVWADSGGGFWPITIADVTGDGLDEVLAVLDDSTVGVFTLTRDNRMTRVGTIVNPTAAPPGRHNMFTTPSVAIGDLNGNNRPDLLFADADGDFFIVEYQGAGRFGLLWGSENDFEGGSEYVAIADFDGDGRNEFALGLRTTEDDVVPYWFFGIFRLDTQGKAKALWTQRFYGVERSGSFGTFSRIQNSLSAGNIDDDAAAELVITVFPELYIVKYEAARAQFAVVHTAPLVNTNAAAIADFDGNGIPECAVGVRDSVVFLQRDLTAGGPTAVTFLDVTYMTPRAVRVSWNAPLPSPQYRLYKGSTAAGLQLFGTFTVVSVVDYDLDSTTTTVYGVTAYDSTRVPTESRMFLSRVLRPHAAPRCDTASFLGGGQVRLSVSQDIGPDIPSASSFLLDDARAPVSVALLSPRVLLLSFGSIPDGTHGIRVRGLRDAEGIPFDEEGSFAVFDVRNTPSDLPCYIERIDFIPPETFAVTFSQPLDSLEAERPERYVFQPGGPARSARYDPENPRRVLVGAPAGLPVGALGHEYVLAVRDMRCASGAMVVEGAGSTAGIVLNRANLDDMFVYPNPLRPNDGQEFVTFANLTPRATIRIYTVSGRFIREIEENDGNGGVEWRLDDTDGRRVPAGVYIYYAVGRDAAGNEIGRRTGKFAIAR
ncbi:MAG: S8 family serine peptidase [Bacteroidota bacterium]|nr:S8 family serine peptidase [Bacteroidota bacterium]